MVGLSRAAAVHVVAGPAARLLGENLKDDRWARQIMGYASVAGVAIAARGSSVARTSRSSSCDSST